MLLPENVDIYHHAGSKILTWTDQLHFIQNRLDLMQQKIVEEQLIRAIDQEDVDLLLRLMERYEIDGNYLFQIQAGGQTLLTYAIDTNRLKMVLFLVETCHADVNRADRSTSFNPEGMTPLLMAIARGHTRIVQFLLAKNASADLSCGPLLPLSFAISLGRKEIAQQLLDVPNLMINTVAPGGMGPIQAAIVQENESLIRLLVERGADINGVDGTGSTPLTFACLNKKTTMARFLFLLGANPEQRDQHGRLPEECSQLI